MEIKDRRDFLKIGGGAFLGLASLSAFGKADLKDLEVKKRDDFEPVPTFQDGNILEADQLQSLSTAILQLQNEIKNLRRL